jgi:hypothetical protein
VLYVLYVLYVLSVLSVLSVLIRINMYCMYFMYCVCIVARIHTNCKNSKFLVHLWGSNREPLSTRIVLSHYTNASSDSDSFCQVYKQIELKWPACVSGRPWHFSKGQYALNGKINIQCPRNNVLVCIEYVLCMYWYVFVCQYKRI